MSSIRKKKTTQISANTSQNDPVPDIILGKNQFSTLPVTFDVETNTGFLPSIVPVQSPKELDILNPKDNESLSTKKPDFFGTGPINSKIKIEVHSSTVYNGEVTTQSDGSWNWSPSSDLAPGEHTITATIIENGVEKNISRKFTVLAADNSLAYSASSSATTPTPTPSLKITPTLVPTKIPTLIPTIRTSKPSTSSGVPTTGNLTPTVVLLLTASFFTFLSLFSFKKK